MGGPNAVRLRLLLVGRVPLAGTTTLGDWQLARALARRGHEVTYVDPPRLLHHVLRTGDPTALRGERAVHEGIRVVTPLALPGAHRTWGARLSNRLIRGQLPHEQHDASVVFDPRRADLATLLGPRTAYWRRDAFAWGGAEALHAARIEARALSTYPLVCCVSARLAEQVRGAAVRTVVIPNGCDYDHFATAPAAPDAVDGVVVSFVGGVGWRVDVELLAAVARLRPSWRIVVTGEIARDDLPDLANLEFEGRVPFAEVPSRIGRAHVGLIPYTDHEFNRSSFPLKAFEYLAAGRPVVSTPIDAMVPLAPHVRTADSPRAVVAAVEAAVADGPSTDSCRRLARDNSWGARAQRLVDELLALPSTGT